MKRWVHLKDSAIPVAAVSTLWGLQDRPIKVEIESSNQVQHYDILSMNPVEIACVRGYADMLRYFVYDLKLQTGKGFNVDNENLPIDRKLYIYVPILAKEEGVFEILMNIPTLWSYEDLR